MGGAQGSVSSPEERVKIRAIGHPIERWTVEALGKYARGQRALKG